LQPTESEANANKPRVNLAALGILAIVSACVYAVDQLTKALVTQNLPLGSTVPFLGQLLQFHFVKNPGAAFSLGSGSTWVFAVFIVLFARRIRSIGWAVLFGMLLGGTLGNLTDRLAREPGFGRGHVVDFLQLYGFPAIFNIADIAIVSSMCLFVLLTIAGVGLDGRREKRSRVLSQPGASDQS